MRQSEYVTKHPKLLPANFDSTVALGFHGDAGAFNKNDGLLVLSWNSLLGWGNTRRKRFVFSFIRKSDYSQESLDAIWRIFGWSMNLLLDGLTPHFD